MPGAKVGLAALLEVGVELRRECPPRLLQQSRDVDHRGL